MATATRKKGLSLNQRFWRWFDDAKLMQLVFYALLAGAATILWTDFKELTGNDIALPGLEASPVLPAIDRPEIDPSAPQFAPREQVTTGHDVLAAPMTMALTPGGIMRLEGTITPGSATRFAEEIEVRGEYIGIVTLNSPGGSVDDALAIASLIREKGYATEVKAGALCASSCPLVFAAGSTRLADRGAVIGVHQIFAGGGDLPGAAQAMSDAQATTARIQRHLTEMEVDPALWVHALETPPDKLYYFTPDELTDLKLATELTG